MVTIPNNDVWYVGKLLRQQILRVLITRKIFSFFLLFFLLYMYEKMNVSWTYCHNHFITHTNQTVAFNLFQLSQLLLNKNGNARMDETQAEIKIAGRNINNIRKADDTTLMAENEEEQTKEPLNEDERGEWKRWLKTSHKKKKKCNEILILICNNESWCFLNPLSVLDSNDKAACLDPPAGKHGLLFWETLRSGPHLAGTQLLSRAVGLRRIEKLEGEKKWWME